MKAATFSEHSKFSWKVLICIIGGVAFVVTASVVASRNYEDIKKIEKKNDVQDEQITQGRVMIGELKAQTRLMQKAVEKLDDKIERQKR